MAVQLAVAVLANGRSLLFEQDTPLGLGALPVGISDLNGRIDFAAAVETVKAAASEFIESFASLAKPPDSCTLSFGIKLNATAGVILAKAETEANFTVKLAWSSTKKT